MGPRNAAKTLIAARSVLFTSLFLLCQAEQLIGFDPTSLPRWQPGSSPWLEYAEDGPHEISKVIRRQLAKRKRLAAIATTELEKTAQAPPKPLPQEDSPRPLPLTPSDASISIRNSMRSSLGGNAVDADNVVESCNDGILVRNLPRDPSATIAIGNLSEHGSPVPGVLLSSVNVILSASPDAEML